MIGGITGVFHKKAFQGAHKIADSIELLGSKGCNYATCSRSNKVYFGRMTLPFYSNENLFPSEINNCSITATCIINNKIELCKILGINSNTEDSEIILISYLKWGKSCVDYLEGKYAFAIWDENNQELFCAKSATGGIDFVYYTDDEKFVFGTQIKSVIKLLGFQPPLNEEFIAEFVDDIIGDKYSTTYQGIKHLPSGYMITVSANKIEEKQFWKPEIKSKIVYKNNSDYIEAASEILNTILQGYTDTGLKIGLQTGGGLKSACIASHLNKKLATPLTGVSYILSENYSGDLKDEKAYTDLLAKHLKMNLHYVNEPKFPHPYDEDIELKMLQQDSPIVNPIGSDHYYVYGKMKELGVQICLTPESKSIDWSGNDAVSTIFSEGKYYEAWKLNKQINNESFLRNAIIPNLPSIIIDTYLKFRKQTPQFLSHPNIVSNYKLAEKIEIYKNEISSNYSKNNKQLININKSISRSKKYISAQEYRYNFIMVNPLSDRRLIDFSLSIPKEQFIYNGENRSLIKRMLQGKVPEQIYLNPSKASYPADMRDRWLNAKPFIFEHFNNISKNSEVWNYINKEMADKILFETNNSKQYNIWIKNRQKLNKVILLDRFLKFLL